MQQAEETQEKKENEMSHNISVQNLMDKIKIFLIMRQLKEDSIPIEIIPNLYLGCLGCALNKKKLLESNIKFILSACEMPQAPFSKDFASLIININDSVDQDIKSKFDESNAFIENAVNTQQNILVHCFAGKSRSTTFIIAYLIKNHKMTVNDALELVKTKRPIAQPNTGFMKQLQQYYDTLYNTIIPVEKQQE
ncbi:unnamed protein product (macronuclear) [Paramecium tetraurelia]|uniref:protein-tyrosine-phosphatase n=1 Tax=Paramecium tetraurelia TaxID=5888 RepID=A0EH81_PARTE|nr:uncharacterized protein GSPATT00026996001 [Paramecium tetraurelia]CAK94672.1 unnamed protein product [Paramecium tetraurelia]|eukprot:XP_001462045.1 hypothetical protein (macronuclear) [Paramecium tetraurelia strain d4-2]